MENQIVELTQEKLNEMQEQVYRMMDNDRMNNYNYKLYDLSRDKPMYMGYGYYALRDFLEQIMDTFNVYEHHEGYSNLICRRVINTYELQKVITDIKSLTKMFYKHIALLKLNVIEYNISDIRYYQEQFNDAFVVIKVLYRDVPGDIVSDLFKELYTHSSIVNQHINSVYIMLCRDHRDVLDQINYSYECNKRNDEYIERIEDWA